MENLLACPAPVRIQKPCVTCEYMGSSELMQAPGFDPRANHPRLGTWARTVASAVRVVITSVPAGSLSESDLVLVSQLAAQLTLVCVFDLVIQVVSGVQHCDGHAGADFGARDHLELPT